MNFIIINSTLQKEFKKAWKLYEDSFPSSEKRVIAEQEKTFFKEQYKFLTIFDDDLFVGILTFWEIEDFIFIEHLAINPELRGQNYGSKVLNVFLEKYSNIILEIEPVVDEATKRRLNFYTKLGFVQNSIKHFQVPFRKNDEKLALEILSYKTSLSNEKYQALYKKMNLLLPI